MSPYNKAVSVCHIMDFSYSYKFSTSTNFRMLYQDVMDLSVKKAENNIRSSGGSMTRSIYKYWLVLICAYCILYDVRIKVIK